MEGRILLMIEGKDVGMAGAAAMGGISSSILYHTDSSSDDDDRGWTL